MIRDGKLAIAVSRKNTVIDYFSSLRQTLLTWEQQDLCALYNKIIDTM